MTNQDVPCGNKNCPYFLTCIRAIYGHYVKCDLYKPDPTEEMYRIQDCAPKEEAK